MLVFNPILAILLWPRKEMGLSCRDIFLSLVEWFLRKEKESLQLP